MEQQEVPGAEPAHDHSGVHRGRVLYVRPLPCRRYAGSALSAWRTFLAADGCGACGQGRASHCAEERHRRLRHSDCRGDRRVGRPWPHVRPRDLLTLAELHLACAACRALCHVGSGRWPCMPRHARSVCSALPWVHPPSGAERFLAHAPHAGSLGCLQQARARPGAGWAAYCLALAVGGAGPRPSCMVRAQRWASPSSTAWAHWAASAVRSLPGKKYRASGEEGTHTLALLSLGYTLSVFGRSVSAVPVSGAPVRPACLMN